MPPRAAAVQAAEREMASALEKAEEDKTRAVAEAAAEAAARAASEKEREKAAALEAAAATAAAAANELRLELEQTKQTERRRAVESAVRAAKAVQKCEEDSTAALDAERAASEPFSPLVRRRTSRAVTGGPMRT